MANPDDILRIRAGVPMDMPVKNYTASYIVNEAEAAKNKKADAIIDYIKYRHAKMASSLVDLAEFMFEGFEFEDYINELNGGWFV